MKQPPMDPSMVAHVNKYYPGEPSQETTQINDLYQQIATLNSLILTRIERLEETRGC